MATDYETLLSFLTDNGISRAEAEVAVQKCARAMALSGAKGYLAGGIVGFFMGGASAPGMAMLGGGVGAAYGLATSPSCGEVRNALSYWRRQ